MEGEKEVRFIIQRVRHASVTIDGEVRGKIGKGFMVLIGIGADDTKEMADKLVRKLVNMRILRMLMDGPILD